jgi:integrase
MQPVEVPKEEPTFHVFASEWYAARESEGLAVKTLVDLKWSLSNHLLPYFAAMRLSAIDARAVDAYKVAKAKQRADIEARKAKAKEAGEKFTERGLSNSSINHTLRHLSQILEDAVDYGLIPSNPARGKKRRLNAAKPARPWVEPEQLMAFLDAAPTGAGGTLLAILAGGGLRIGEALALR